LEISPETGYPLRPGHSYQIKVNMTERDPFGSFDDMGEREIMLTQENDWGTHGGYNNRGFYSLRSARVREFGDYVVDFEVRKVPLPDLHPFDITLHQSPVATKQRVCMAVQNVGVADAGPFELALRIDGVVSSDGRATAGGLPAGEISERCVDTRLPTSGQHRLEALIDEPRALVEYDETNNVFEQAYTATLQPASTSAQQGSTAAADRTELTVRAIKVNGQAPDGKDDCKDGKNEVTVVIKNDGSADAEGLTVRLDVDGAEAATQAVAKLAAGDEREVRFGDVRLKKGERTLAATVDLKDAGADADQDAPGLKVTAGCTAAS
jgi:subtilase family serine protease